MARVPFWIENRIKLDRIQIEPEFGTETKKGIVGKAIDPGPVKVSSEPPGSVLVLNSMIKVDKLGLSQSCPPWTYY